MAFLLLGSEKNRTSFKKQEFSLIITARGLSLPTFNMELHATAILAQIDISESATNSKVLVGHFAMSLSHAQLATNHN